MHWNVWPNGALQAPEASDCFHHNATKFLALHPRHLTRLPPLDCQNLLFRHVRLAVHQEIALNRPAAARRKVAAQFPKRSGMSCIHAGSMSLSRRKLLYKARQTACSAKKSGQKACHKMEDGKQRCNTGNRVAWGHKYDIGLGRTEESVECLENTSCMSVVNMLHRIMSGYGSSGHRSSRPLRHDRRSVIELEKLFRFLQASLVRKARYFENGLQELSALTLVVTSGGR